MDPFTRLTSLAIPMPASNVDTDVIFPARFLLITAKSGLGRYAFYEWRSHGQDRGDAAFPVDSAAFKRARIMVTGENFGCGSSREQAVWALCDLGLKCLIAPSFGEIFQSNCFKNGLLALTVTPDEQQLLLSDAEAGLPITVDLDVQIICRANGQTIPIQVEPWRREALLQGWDEIAMVLNQDLAAITAFEQRQRVEKPWLYLRE